MTINAIIPTQNGTQFRIKEMIPTSWAGIYRAIEKCLKERLPHIVSVFIMPKGDVESGDDLIEVIHDFNELREQAIRAVLEKMTFDQNKRCVLLYEGAVVTPD